MVSGFSHDICFLSSTILQQKSNPIFLLLQSARSEGESSGEQSCDSSDEGVGRDVPAPHPHQPHQPLQTHQALQHQPMQLQPSHNLSHHASVQHQPLNSHQMTHPHQRNSPRPLERELKVSFYKS